MHYQENAEVVTPDGTKVGNIDRVVMDPKTKEVTHIVIRQGFLFTRDKVIPVDLVQRTAEETIVLKQEAGDAGEFPDFEETHYMEVEQGDRNTGMPYARPIMWYFPYAGIAWWGGLRGYPAPLYYEKTERNIPDGAIALEEGAKVTGSDGGDLGTVERIYTEPEGHCVTHLLVVSGLIMKEKKLIPVNWIDNVSEGEIRLAVGTDVVARVKPYTPSD
jgi:uncharacterized protein YrrD